MLASGALGVDGLVGAAKMRGERARLGELDEPEVFAVDGRSHLYAAAAIAQKGGGDAVALFMQRMQGIREHGHQIVVVFDGGVPPVKGPERFKRKLARDHLGTGADHDDGTRSYAPIDAAGAAGAA